MGILKCVCISDARKTSARNIHRCSVTTKGLLGDIHYGLGQKQVSMLPYDRVKAYFCEASQDELCSGGKAKETAVVYGRFGENLVVDGLHLEELHPGDILYSQDVILEVVKIGAGGPASDAYQGEKICSPMEPYFVFCKVLQGGTLSEGQTIDLSASRQMVTG